MASCYTITCPRSTEQSYPTSGKLVKKWLM